MWVVPYLPTNDGPEWVFAAHIENHYSDPATPYYSGTYVPALQFASRGFLFLYAPLEAALGWQHGLQLALSVVVLVVAWSFVALVRAVDPRRVAVAFLGFPLALSWTVYMGFWSFALATGGGLLVVALAVRAHDPQRGGPSAWSRVAVAAALLCVGVAHIFAAVITGIALTSLLVARAPTGKRLGEVARVALMGLPAAAIALASVAVAHANAVTSLAFATDVLWLPWRKALAILPQILWPGPLLRAVVASALIGVASASAALRAVRKSASAVDRGLGIAGAIFLLAVVFAPTTVPGWQFLSQRFVSAGVALALAVVPLERLSPAMHRASNGVLFVLAVVSLCLSYPMHVRLAARCADAIAGLAAPIHRSGPLLPVALAAVEGEARRSVEGEVPMLNSLLHMGALYAAVEGGLTPYVFASNSATHPFTLRPNNWPVPVPDVGYYWNALRTDEFHDDRTLRVTIQEDLASYGMVYEGVVLVGARPDDVALWKSRGFVSDWERGATFLGHFVPCGIDFTVPATLAAVPPTFDVGWGRLMPIEGAQVAGRVGSDGLAHFNLSQAPCGEVRVRARWGPIAPGEPARLCSNADPDGTITTRVTRSSHRVACLDVGTPRQAAEGGHD